MIFYDTGLIENYGSGIQRIFDKCHELGFPEPVFKELDGGFQVTLHKDIYNEEYLAKLGLNERQIKAVMYAKEKGKITNSEYQGIGKTSKPTATRELTALVVLNLLEKQGVTGKGTYYSLLKGSKRPQRGHKRVKHKKENNPIIRREAIEKPFSNLISYPLRFSPSALFQGRFVDSEI